jgi:molybdopterin biosynthesis enzyme
MRTGTVLSPAELGMLASVGVSKVKCFKAARICVLSTGDELCDAGDEPTGGKIWDRSAGRSRRHTPHHLTDPIWLPVAIVSCC